MLDDTETLKFRNGKFILENASTPKLRENLSRNAYWKSLPDDAYETVDLRAATRFRQYADAGVEKFFKTIFQAHYPLPSIPSSLPLDPHQWEGLKWILSRKRSYLAHAPGAGKTAQAILAACLTDCPERQSVFIVPPQLVKNWEREIFKFTEWLQIPWPCIGLVTANTLKKDAVAWKADFLIVADSILHVPRVNEKLFAKGYFRLIAVDEASRFKEPFARRSLALFGGRNGNATYKGVHLFARHVVLLDGSPMPNRPIELWAPTYAMHPEAIDCMNYDDFGYRYCGAKPNEHGQWEYKYSSHEAELRARLQKDFMHVVTEDKLTHPERLRSMVIMNEDVRTAEQKRWEAANITSGFTLPAFDNLEKGELAEHRAELGLRKVNWVVRYVRDKLESTNESILLFTWHRDVASAIAFQMGSDHHQALIIGGCKPEVRDRLMQEFQDKKRRLLIMNVLVAGRGFNLQGADRVIFAEWSWTDEVNRQCEKRASRKGSDKEFVRCEYLVCPNSIDEIVLRSVFTKAKRVNKVIG